MHIAIYVAAAIAAAGAGCAFAQVGDALQRPALSVKAPQRTVLLAAAAAGQRLVAVGERGVVALSDDRGATWRQAACPVSVSLTMVRFADERRGVAGLHIEDQGFPKKCGHLEDKVIVPLEDYVAKIRAAVSAKTDPNFMVIARTDARSSLGFEAAVGLAHWPCANARTSYC